MIRRTLLAIPVTVLAALAAAAPGHAGSIYRCQDGETVVFSDRPCDDTAEPLASLGTLSVVEAPEDLTAIAERNQDYLESRKDERRAQRAEREAARRAEAEAARRVPPAVRTVPVYPFADYGQSAPADRSATATNRLEALRSSGRPAATSERRQPVSALSGRQLGSRRSDDDG